MRAYTKGNNYNSIDEIIIGNDLYETFSLDYFNRVTTRFFGRNYSDYEASQFKRSPYEYYENGTFWFLTANGVWYVQVAVVKEIRKLPNGNYEMEYSIFEWSPEDWTGLGYEKQFYSMNIDEASVSPKLNFVSDGVATVEVIENDGSESYHLLTYSGQ